MEKMDGFAISAIEIAAYDLISKSKKSLSNFLSIKSKVNKMYWSIGHGFKKSIYQMQKILNSV